MGEFWFQSPTFFEAGIYTASTATTAMSGYHSPFNSPRSTSFVSSPLASSPSHKLSIAIPTSRPQPARNPSFPPSRPLRPFASIAQSIAPPKRGTPTSKKPVKLIEQPKNHKGTFLLNLTQAELSRQDWGYRVWYRVCCRGECILEGIAY